jgi:hypothetical protein
MFGWYGFGEVVDGGDSSLNEAGGGGEEGAYFASSVGMTRGDSRLAMAKSCQSCTSAELQEGSVKGCGDSMNTVVASMYKVGSCSGLSRRKAITLNFT